MALAIDIGLGEKEREGLCEKLSVALADTYVLSQRAQEYHWNVEGEQFVSLHGLFETQYRDLWEAGDDLAERIRALGGYAPGGGRFGELTTLGKGNEKATSGEEMVASMVRGHEGLVRTLRGVVGLAEEAGDVVTADLCTQRLGVSEKAAWMLRSVLA